MTNKPNITGCINRAIDRLEIAHIKENDIPSIKKHAQALADLKAFRDALQGYPLEHYQDFLKRGEIMRHNEEGIERIAELTAQAVSDEAS